MSEKRFKKHYVRRTRNRVREDRLSSLPDAILIDILSRLEIDNAVATSALSSRWRHLWTAVTCFRFLDLLSIIFGKYRRVGDVILDVLQELTSRKLYVFTINIAVFSVRAPNIVESCFRELSFRNVEQIIIDSISFVVFDAPACLFEIQSLVILEVEPLCFVRLPDNVAAIHFPYLKKLCLGTIVSFPSWLGTLLSSCLLLEHLKLSFDLFKRHSQPHSDLQITASNLKLLHIQMLCPTQTPRPKIFIGAPTLESLEIYDSASCYYFVKKPTRLTKARIMSKTYEWYVEDEEVVGVEEEYLYQMSKFVAGMSSATELELELSLVYKSQNNIYTYLNMLNHQPLTTIFPNLTFLRTALDGIGLNGWKDLLLSLQCFPNLNHLKVDMDSYYPSEKNSYWCVPDSVPDCLVSKLKEVEITINLAMIDDEFRLLAYILSNAIVLQKLHLSVGIKSNNAETRVMIAHKICRLLVKLPRGSSSCEIVISSRYESIMVSSNEFKD